jgi:2-phosphosulfolactate phosphatase
MKTGIPEAKLIGERNERKPDGFDFGNSPFLLLKGDVKGFPLIHTTSSGTQGIVNAIQADQIITGSFVNAGAITRYIRKCQPDQVSLVCMGYACQYPTDEDTLCAEYIRNELTGLPNDWEMKKNRIRNCTGSRFFENDSQEWAPQEDFELCLDLNRFDFVLKVERQDNFIFLRKVDIP